jgi:hypothetical protein
MVRRRLSAPSRTMSYAAHPSRGDLRPLLRMRLSCGDRIVAYVAFFEANVVLMLSNNSTFTPLRRMMKLCCSTDSVLFQAQ